MDTSHIAALLAPFLGGVSLPENQLASISTYIDVLIHWNTRINLTAIREPDEIVTRHFGESLFCARHLFPAPAGASGTLADLGSGAGFPGIPISIWAPGVHVTVIESNQKKATFLREVLRTVKSINIDVYAGRAEDLVAGKSRGVSANPAGKFDVVTLRAVEHFEDSLPLASRLTAPQGRLALLIGQDQAKSLPGLALNFAWAAPVAIPQSRTRVLLLGRSLC